MHSIYPPISTLKTPLNTSGQYTYSQTFSNSLPTHPLKPPYHTPCKPPNPHYCSWYTQPQASIQTPTGEQSIWAIDMTLYRNVNRSSVAKGMIVPHLPICFEHTSLQCNTCIYVEHFLLRNPITTCVILPPSFPLNHPSHHQPFQCRTLKRKSSKSVS